MPPNRRRRRAPARSRERTAEWLVFASPGLRSSPPAPVRCGALATFSQYEDWIAAILAYVIQFGAAWVACGSVLTGSDFDGSVERNRSVLSGRRGLHVPDRNRVRGGSVDCHRTLYL